MRATVWLCIVGCSYAPKTGMVESDGSIGDAPADTALDPDAKPDTPVVAIGCDTIPLGLVACYSFDDISSGFIDSTGNHDATAANFTAITRDVPAPSPAIQMTAQSASKAAQSVAWNLNADFTLTVWMRPENPGPTENEGILDHEGAWALSIFNGNLRCWSNRTVSGLFTIESSSFTNNAWQFVACTVAGNQGCVHRIDAITGEKTENCGTAPNNGTNGGQGISIGSFQDGGGNPSERFNGAIDDLRIYSRALSDQELCTLSGHAVCL